MEVKKKYFSQLSQIYLGTMLFLLKDTLGMAF